VTARIISAVGRDESVAWETGKQLVVVALSGSGKRLLCHYGKGMKEASSLGQLEAVTSAR